MHNRYMRDTTTHAHAYDFSALPCDRSASCLCMRVTMREEKVGSQTVTETHARVLHKQRCSTHRRSPCAQRRKCTARRCHRRRRSRSGQGFFNLQGGQTGTLEMLRIHKDGRQLGVRYTMSYTGAACGATRGHGRRGAWCARPPRASPSAPPYPPPHTHARRKRSWQTSHSLVMSTHRRPPSCPSGRVMGPLPVRRLRVSSAAAS